MTADPRYLYVSWASCIILCFALLLDKLKKIKSRVTIWWDMTSCSVCRTIWPVSSATPTAQHQLDHCYGACTGCQSGSLSTLNSPNFVTWLLLSNSQATSLIWSDHTLSLVCCDHPHRSFCQFRRTTWKLLLVVSLLLLLDSGTLFHWTVELLHPLTHLRYILRHFSLIRHNRTVARASVLWHDINLLIDWLIDQAKTEVYERSLYSVTYTVRLMCISAE